MKSGEQADYESEKSWLNTGTTVWEDLQGTGMAWRGTKTVANDLRRRRNLVAKRSAIAVRRRRHES